MFPELPTLGSFAYLGDESHCRGALLRPMLESCLKLIGIEDTVVQAALFRAPMKTGKWRKQLWKAFDEAMESEDVEALNLLVGTSQDVRFAATLKLRRAPGARKPARTPLYFGFACEAERWPAEGIAAAGRHFLETLAREATPLFGAAFRAPSFNQAMYEIHDGGNLEKEPTAFQERIKADMRLDEYWTKARRLYPITLLGPHLASQGAAAEARAAGALAVEEINGSILIDAYPTVVETWAPEFLKATVELRRWLWPHSIQNPADAVGLGLKLPKR